MLGILLICVSLVAIDGDTIKCDGIYLRDMGDGAPHVSGYDTPELRGSACPQEKALAQAATARMGDLLSQGVTIHDSGERDRYGRPLVWARLPDGRSVGSVLIAEGLAREWAPGYEPGWCP